jgi:rhodanese-related sulfurtransferase
MTVDEMLSDARAIIKPRLSPEEALREMENGALLVDIRYLEQRVRDGDIPNAVLVNRNEFEWRCDPSAEWRHTKIKHNDYDQRIIVLCNQGYQSSFAAANLIRLGLRNATDVEGGMENWISHGLPIVPYDKREVRELLYAEATN